MIRRRFLPALLFASLLAAGCAAIPPATVPMATLERRVGDGNGPRVLLVMLHGRGGQANDFFDEGFDQVAAETGGRFDLLAVEAHLGYYLHGDFELRLATDVLIPARSRGYDAVWLVGVSMGGFGALATAQKHPDLVDGVIALAPYLGAKRVLDSVGSDRPLAAEAGSEDHRMKDLWDWVARTPAGDRPPILLGTGDRDDLAEAARLFARFGPAGTLDVVPGGHDWGTWKSLFRRALARSGSPLAVARRPG